MSAPPYMNVYIADYTADVQALTCEQDGAYWRLLRAMWRANGKLPNVPQKLATICGLSLDRWQEIGPDVVALFQRRGGSLTHKRLNEELNKIAAKSEVRSEAGKRGAAKKASKNNGKASAIASDLPKQTPSISEPELDNPPIPPQGGGAQTETLKGIVLRRAHIEEAWALATKASRERSSKADLESALKGAAARGKRPADVMVGLRGYFASDEARRDDGRFAKGIHRIIANDRWESFVDHATPLEALAAAAAADPSESWRRRVKGLVSGSKFWNPTDWGPEPGRPGSNVPAQVQREFGFTPPSLEGAAA